jgi:hypothetical protein
VALIQELGPLEAESRNAPGLRVREAPSRDSPPRTGTASYARRTPSVRIKTPDILRRSVARVKPSNKTLTAVARWPRVSRDSSNRVPGNRFTAHHATRRALGAPDALSRRAPCSHSSRRGTVGRVRSNVTHRAAWTVAIRQECDNLVPGPSRDAGRKPSLGRPCPRPDDHERRGGRTTDRLRPTRSYTTLWDVTLVSSRRMLVLERIL